MRGEPLQHQRALITGASAGIGEAFAQEFARHKFNLVLVARSRSRLKELAEELERAHGIEVQVRACDLTEPGAAQALFEDCAELDIDVLVNNAGVMYHGSLCDQPADSIDSIVQLNIAGLTQLTRAFLAPMLKNGSGRILNITSTTAFQGAPTLAVYAASKSYILSFTEALAEELRGSGVTATAFCPGSTDTNMVSRSYGEALRANLSGSLLMMSTSEVARQGYAACMAGDTISIPGLTNKLLNSLGRIQPRWMNRRVQAYMYKKFLDDENG